MFSIRGKMKRRKIQHRQTGGASVEFMNTLGNSTTSEWALLKSVETFRGKRRRGRRDSSACRMLNGGTLISRARNK